MTNLIRIYPGGLANVNYGRSFRRLLIPPHVRSAPFSSPSLMFDSEIKLKQVKVERDQAKYVCVWAVCVCVSSCTSFINPYMVYVHVTYEHASAVHRSHGEMLDSIVPPLEKQRHELRDLINKSLKVTLPLIRSHTHTHTRTHTHTHTRTHTHTHTHSHTHNQRL